MTYIVKVPFSYQNKAGKLIQAKVGDELPDFVDWSYCCQRAHLDLGWIEKKPDQAPVKPEKVQGKGHSKNR